MFGGRYRARPTQFILKEVEHYHQVRNKTNFLFSIDDDINDPKTIYPILEAINKHFGYMRGGWGSTTDMNLIVNFKGEVNHKFLSLANKTNCFSLYFGFENVNPRVLKEEIGTKKNSPKFYPRLAKACHDYGITIWVSTIISPLSTTWRDVEFMVDWYNWAEVDLMAWTVLTPLPATRLFDKIYREGLVYPGEDRRRARRVAWLDLNWSKYDCTHCVWLPEGANYTSREYEEMRDWAQQGFERHPLKSIVLALMSVLKGDIKRAVYRHGLRVGAALKHSGILSDAIIERMFFGKRTYIQLH